LHVRNNRTHRTASANVEDWSIAKSRCSFAAAKLVECDRVISGGRINDIRHGEAMITDQDTNDSSGPVTRIRAREQNRVDLSGNDLQQNAKMIERLTKSHPSNLDANFDVSESTAQLRLSNS